MNSQSFDARCFVMVFTFLTIQEIDVHFKIKTIKILILILIALEVLA